MNDFENVLAALIALKNNENDHYIEQCKLAELNNTPNPHTPETSIDKLFAIWKDVFPQRELFVEDSKFLANIPNKSSRCRQILCVLFPGKKLVSPGCVQNR